MVDPFYQICYTKRVMNCNPTINSQDFSTIHNALCELRSLQGTMTPDQNHTVAIANIIAKFEKGLAGAYQQDDQAFELKSDHYETIQNSNDFYSRWSLYDVDDLTHPHGYSQSVLVYQNHWGGKVVLIPITGLTWVDLWRAADLAIKKSGDDHHIFIEGFCANDQDQLELCTGR